MGFLQAIVVAFVLAVTSLATSLGFFHAAQSPTTNPSPATSNPTTAISNQTPGSTIVELPGATSSEWIRLSTLPPPPSTLSIRFENTGGSIYFSYDGTDGGGTLVPVTNPEYPNANTIRLTAFEDSQLEVNLPANADIPTLMLSRSFDFMKDKNSVYYSDCEGYQCTYDLLTGAEPATFEELSTSTQHGLETIYAKDANHVYACTQSPIQCTAVQ